VKTSAIVARQRTILFRIWSSSGEVSDNHPSRHKVPASATGAQSRFGSNYLDALERSPYRRMARRRK
jgi:hypothetical protein